MDINRQAPAYNRVEAYIAASPGDIYDVVSHFNHWNEWQSGVRMIRAPRLPQKEDLFKWTNGGMVITSVLTCTQRGKELRWKSKAMWIRASISWEFETENDGCRVYYEQSIEGFGAVLMKPALSNSMETTLLELKKFCENELVPA